MSDAPTPSTAALRAFEPYREFIDDWPAFADALGRKEPTTIRVNRLRADIAGVRAMLEREGFVLEGVDAQPWFLRVVDGPRSVSDTFAHWAGLVYIQQAATGIAADLLGARPGERVLDLCAAPGGKTLHVAETMEGRGAVVASEVNEGRIRALLGNIYRLGTPNIMVVSGDGRELPVDATFDRVLVDVPCSAQGTVRKKAGQLPSRSRGYMAKIVRAQEKLLRRAIAAARPGGVILYVTCTFGPDENERVVSRVLADTDVEVEPMHPLVRHAPGLTRWGAERYDARLAGAVRIYPHHLDSGGLFLCRLRRGGTPSPVHGWSPIPGVFESGRETSEPADVAAEARRVLREHYGVDPEAWAGMSWMRRGSNLWMHALPDWPLGSWDEGGHWRMVALGLRAFDLRGDGPPRPTNDLLQWLDDQVTRNRADLTPRQWLDVLDGRTTTIPGVERGHLALGVELDRERHVAGWGFVRDGRLKDHIPRGRRAWLRSVVAGALEG